MSQKTNPTGLRLFKNNQNFSCPGFADFFFTENFHYRVEIEKYISVFLRQTQYSKAFFSGKNQYRNYSIWLFLQDSRADRIEKQSFLKYKSFKKSESLRNSSKLLVLRMLSNNKEKNLSLYSSKQKKSKNLFSNWRTISEANGTVRDAPYNGYIGYISSPTVSADRQANIDSFRDSFTVDAGRCISSPTCINFVDATTADAKGENILISPSLPFWNNKVAQNELYLDDKTTYNPLRNRSIQNNREKRKKENKIGKTEWIRENYILVSLFFFCTKDAVKKHYQHSFFDSEKPVSTRKERNFFSDYFLFKNDFRKFIVNDFLRIKQSKRFYTKVEQLGEKIDKFKLRPKSLKKVDIKNAISLVDFEELAAKIMPTAFRSNLSLRPFNCLSYENNLTINPMTTTIREKADKTVKCVANSSFAINYSLKTLYSAFDSQNLDFTKQNYTQQNNLKVPTIVDLRPIRFIKDQQNVMSLLNQIVILLEKRVSFRKIKSLVSKDFSNFSNYFHLKGLRIACSGRLGGRSKKAQKAKMQCANFGQTSLSAFSSKLMFGSQNAYTPSGLIGVKLWLCFKTTRF